MSGSRQMALRNLFFFNPPPSHSIHSPSGAIGSDGCWPSQPGQDPLAFRFLHNWPQNAAHHPPSPVGHHQFHQNGKKMEGADLSENEENKWKD